MAQVGRYGPASPELRNMVLRLLQQNGMTGNNLDAHVGNIIGTLTDATGLDDLQQRIEAMVAEMTKVNPQWGHAYLKTLGTLAAYTGEDREDWHWQELPLDPADAEAGAQDLADARRRQQETSSGTSTTSGSTATTNTGGAKLTPRAVRAFADLLSKGVPITDWNAQEVVNYLGQEDTGGGTGGLRASNLLRLMGYEPDMGNPTVGFLQSTVPTLSLQSNLQNILSGKLATPLTDSEDAKRQAGAEGLLRAFGEVTGAMGSGATSLFTPQQGQAKLGEINAMLEKMADPGATKTLEQEQLLTNLTDPKGGAAGNVLDTILALIGGGMSPMFRGNQQLMNRTAQRLYEQYQNAGTGAGGFLNWLMQRGIAGAA